MNPLVLVLAIAAVVLPPLLQLAAIVILHNASVASGNPVLALLERLRVAQCGFVGTTIVSLLAINGALGRPVAIPPPYNTMLVAMALLIIAAPAGMFVWLFWSGRFGDEE